MAVLLFKTSPAGLLHHFYRLDPCRPHVNSHTPVEARERTIVLGRYAKESTGG